MRNVLMPDSSSQTFRRELDKKLRTAADRLRSNLGLSRQSETAPDAAVYKHVVLAPANLAGLTGLIATIPVPARGPSRKGNFMHQVLLINF